MIRLLGPTPADIIHLAAEMTGVPVELLTGRGPGSGGTLVYRVRAIAYWAARKSTSASYPEIGRAFGRDHRTVMDVLGRVDGDPALLAAAEALVMEARFRCDFPRGSAPVGQVETVANETRRDA